MDIQELILLDCMLISKNMKKIICLSVFTLFFACKDDDIIEGTVMVFYPTSFLEVIEEDGTQYPVRLAATGRLSGEVFVNIQFDNYEFIETVPAHTRGLLKLAVDTNEGIAEFTVEALNDDRPDDYAATFRVVGSSGAVTGISRSSFRLIVEDDDIASVFFEDFETNGLIGWETQTIGEGNAWGTGEFDNSTYADISNFRANELTEGWLISEEIDFVDGENELLSFETQTRFNSEEEIFKAYILTDYTSGSNPTNATLTELTFERDPHDGAGFGNFTTSGNIDLSHIDKVGQIAFYYKAASNSDGSGWSIDNIDLQSFAPDNSGPEGEPTSFTLPFSEDLNDCVDFSIPSTFIQVRTAGSKQDRGWQCGSYGVSGSQAVRATAQGGIVGTVDAWLVSAKAFDLSASSEETLTFDIKSANAGTGELNILWSEDYTGSGEPSTATWTEFAGVTTPVGGSDVYETINVNMQAAVGKEAYIAFQFIGGTNSSSVSYDIDNIAVASGGSSTPGPGETTDSGDCHISGTGTVIVSHDFEGCTEDFSIPNGFIEVNVPETKTDRGWGCRQDGTDNSRAVRASAFGGTDGRDDAWLIMDSFDATPYTEISLTFDMQSPFEGPGNLFVLYSNDYSGSGDPFNANWIQLDNITAQLPVQGAGTFLTVTTSPCNLSGSSVYIAFRYVDGTSAASSAWSIDNLELLGN